MKSTINGKKYDTETAKYVGGWNNGLLANDPRFALEALYQKRTGEFFLYGKDEITPVSKEDAQKWAENKLSNENYEKVFGKAKESNTEINTTKSQETQNQISKDAENTKTEKLYITVPKQFCRQLEDKIHEGKTFNMISIPKGTMLNGKDIGGRVINPKLMYENPYNQNEMVAQYDIGHLTDNSIMLKNLNEATSEKVDIKELKAAIDTQKENYKAMKRQQNEKQPSIHKNREKNKDEEL